MVDLSVFRRSQGLGELVKQNQRENEALAQQQLDNEIRQQQSALAQSKLLNTMNNQGGATGFLVNELRKENPDLTFAQALTLAQGAARKGLDFQEGKFVPIEGFGQGLSAIGQQESFGKEFGKGQAQLQTQPQLEALKAESKLQKELEFSPQIKSSEMLAEAQAQKAIDLPTALSEAQSALNLIGRLKVHEGLSGAVGVRSPAGYLVDKGFGRGTKEAGFKALFEQLGGKNFLQAFESLKGGGQITEVEGKKATDAIAALNTAQREEDFLENLAILESVVIKGMERAQAGVSQVGTVKSTPNTQAATPRDVQKIIFNLEKKGYTKEDIQEYLQLKGLK